MAEYEVPLVLKTPISLVSLGDLREALTLRSVLEGFNYRVDLNYIGSRKEFLEVLSGNIFTFPHLILSCHGDEGCICVTEEKSVGSVEIGELARLKNKTVINTGCSTGKADFVKAFVAKGGAGAYIAPDDDPWGTTALLFMIHLFYHLDRGLDLNEAVKKSADFDEHSNMFKLYQ